MEEKLILLLKLCLRKGLEFEISSVGHCQVCLLDDNDDWLINERADLYEFLSLKQRLKNLDVLTEKGKNDE